MKIKLLRQIAAAMATILLMLSCFYMGTHTEQKFQKVDNEKAEEIVIVNLDEGISNSKAKNEKIYYFNELLGYNETNFRIVSLESARNGIMEGRFGAYVIIPAEFSENVESVNDTPEKSQITYAMNPYLDNETKEVVLKNLALFYENLNYDISYLYVSAVLNDFHEVQDSSKIVLANDADDTERLMAVDPQKLLGLFDYPQLRQIEKEIEELNFNDIFDANTALGKGITENLKEDLKTGELAYQDVQLQSGAVFIGTDHVLEVIDGYSPGYDVEGNLIYQKGIDTVSQNFAKYNEVQHDNAEKLKIEAWNEINRIAAAAVNARTGKIQVSINALNDQVNTVYRELYWENNRLYDYAMRLQKELRKMDHHYRSIGISDNQLYQLATDLVSENEIERGDYQEILFPTVCESVSENDIAVLVPDKQFSGSFLQAVSEATSVSMNDIVEIVDEQIIDELVKQQKSTYRSIQEEKKLLYEQISLYDSMIENYDPFDYIDEERMDNGLKEFEKNILEVETKQEQHDEDYLELIKEIYEVTEENQENFDENLKQSQEITQNNVETTIAMLKDDKAATTQQNKELLELFTQKLAYTRLGSLGKISAYDFIVSPVELKESQVDKTIVTIRNHYQQYILVGIAVFAAVLLLMLLGLFIFQERVKKEGQDNFS